MNHLALAAVLGLAAVLVAYGLGRAVGLVLLDLVAAEVQRCQPLPAYRPTRPATSPRPASRPRPAATAQHTVGSAPG